MDKEFFYMFSQGEYSDYCVGGLYRSKKELTEEDFIRHLRNMLLEQTNTWPEAFEYVKNLKDDLSVLTGYSLQNNLFALAAGDPPDWKNKPAHDLYFAALNKWKKEVGPLDQDYVADMVRKGLLEKIEYEEIWEG